MRTTVAVIGVLLLTSGPAAAETTPPPFKLNPAAAASTLRAPLAIDLRLGRLSVRFERTTLREMQRAVGSGQIAHRGDAGESTYWLCYEGTVDSKSARLWLVAGEINGPEHTIGAFQLQEAGPGPASAADCPPLPASLQPIKLGPAAVLGFTSDAAIARLGEPSSKGADALTYRYLGKRPGTYGGERVEFDRANFLELRLSAGRVVGIVASQSTTY